MKMWGEGDVSPRQSPPSILSWLPASRLYTVVHLQTPIHTREQRPFSGGLVPTHLDPSPSHYSISYSEPHSQSPLPPRLPTYSQPQPKPSHLTRNILGRGGAESCSLASPVVAHLDRGDSRLQSYKDAATFQGGYARVLHVGMCCHEVTHIQHPIRAEQVGEAAATVLRVSRKGHQEAHTSSLVLQAAAPGAPLSFFSCSFGLQLPVGRDVGEEPRPLGICSFPQNSKFNKAWPSHTS